MTDTHVVTEKHECLDAETLAAFIDGRLDGAERTRVEAHLASCEDCYEWFVETARAVAPAVGAATGPAEVERHAGGGRVLPFRRRVMLAAGAGLAAAATLLLAVLLQPTWLPAWLAGGADEPAVAELVLAVADRRTVEGRMTGGFAYGPLRSPVRSGDTTRSRDWELLAAAAKVRRAAEERPTPAARHALGVAHLLLGELDEAVAALEGAVAERPEDAKLHSDLAAAYLARAKQQARAEDYAKALASAERAIKADAGLGEAYFNRALALEGLARNEQARQAWTEYLNRDASSEWAAEARRHLAELSSAGGATQGALPQTGTRAGAARLLRRAPWLS